MPVLTVFAADHPAEPLRQISDPDAVAATLRAAGIGCERWEPIAGLAPGVAPETVLAAYRERIAAVQQQGGYAAVDVVSIAPDDPARDMKRRTFLAEHTHIEDEVRSSPPAPACSACTSATRWCRPCAAPATC